MLQPKNDLAAASRPEPMANVDTPDLLNYMPPQPQPNIRVTKLAPPPSAGTANALPPLTGSEPDEPPLRSLKPSSVLMQTSAATPLRPLINQRVADAFARARLARGSAGLPPLLPDAVRLGGDRASMAALMFAEPAPEETPEELEGNAAWFIRRTREGLGNAGPQMLAEVGNALNLPWYLGAIVEGSVTGKTSGWWHQQAQMGREAVAAARATWAPERDPAQTNTQKLYDPGIVVPMIASFASQLGLMAATGGVVGAGAKAVGGAAGMTLSVTAANRIANAAGSVLGGTVEGQNTYFEGLSLGMTPGEASAAFLKHATASGVLSSAQLAFVLNKMPAPLQHKLLRKFVAGGTDAIAESLDETAGAWSLDSDIGFKEALKVTGDAFAEIGPAAFIVGMVTGGMGLPPEMALKAASAGSAQGQVDFGLGGGKSVMDEVGEERLRGILEKEATWFRTADGVRHSTAGGVVESDEGLFWMANNYGHPDGDLLPVRLSDVVEVGVLGDAGEELITHSSERMALLRESAKRAKDEVVGEMGEFRTTTVEEFREREREIHRAKTRAEFSSYLNSRQEKYAAEVSERETAELDMFAQQMEAGMRAQKNAAGNISGAEEAVKSGMPEIGPDAPVAADVPADQMDKLMAQWGHIAEAEWEAKIGTARWTGLPEATRQKRKTAAVRRLAGLKGDVTRLTNQSAAGIAPSAPGTFAGEVEAMIANYALTGESTPINTLMEEDYVASAMQAYEADIEAKVRTIERIGARLMGGSVESAEGFTYSLKGSVFGPVAETSLPVTPVLTPGDVSTAAGEFTSAAPAPKPLTTGTPELVSGDWYRRLLQYMGSENMLEAVRAGETTVEDVLMTAFRGANKLKFVKDKTGTKLVAAPWGKGTTADTYNANLLAYVAAVREAKTALAYVMENEYSEEMGLDPVNAPKGGKTTGQELFQTGKSTRRQTRKLSTSGEKIAGYAATMKQSTLYNDLVRAGARLGWADNYAAAELASEIVYAQANAQVAAGAVKTVSEYYESYLGQLNAYVEEMTKGAHDVRQATMGFRIPKSMVPGTMSDATFGIPNEMLFQTLPGKATTPEALVAKLAKAKTPAAAAQMAAESGLFPKLTFDRLLAMAWADAEAFTNLPDAAKFVNLAAQANAITPKNFYKPVSDDFAPVLKMEQDWADYLEKNNITGALAKLSDPNYESESPEFSHADLVKRFAGRTLELAGHLNFQYWVGSESRHNRALPKSVDLRFQENGEPRVWFYGTTHASDNFGWIDTGRPHPFFHFGGYQAASDRLSDRGVLATSGVRLLPLVTNMANAYRASDAGANNPYALLTTMAYDNGWRQKAAFLNHLAERGYDLSTAQKKVKAAMEFFGYDGIVYPNGVEGTEDTERYSIAAVLPNTVKSVYHKDIPYIDGMDILNSSVEESVLGTFDPATKNIELFLGSDLHTVLHEFAHAWRQSLTKEQLKAVGKWANGGEWKSGDPWSVKGEEKFADGFVAWAGSGKGAKVPKDLEDTFERIGGYLSGLYREGRALRPDVRVSKTMSDAMEKIFTRQLLRSKDAPEREEGRRRQRLRAQFQPARRMDLGDHIDEMAELLDMPPQSPRDKVELHAEMLSRKRNKKYLLELDVKLKQWEASGNPAIDLVDFMIVRDRAIDIRVKFEGEFRDAYRRGPDAVTALLTRMANDRTEMDIRFYRMVAGDAGRRLNALTNRNTHIDTAILLKSAENQFGSKSFEVLYQMLQHPAQAFELADKMAGEISPGLWDLYMQAHYGFRLSSPDVLAVNFFGTGLWTAWNYTFHRPLAGAVDSTLKAFSEITGFGKVLDRFYFQGNPRARDHFNTSVLPLYSQLTRSVPHGLKLGWEIAADRTGGVHTLGNIKNMDITSRDVNSWQRFTLNRSGITARVIGALTGKKNALAAQLKFENAVHATGYFISLPTTFMRATDMLFKVVAAEGEVNRIAQEEAEQMFPNNPTAQAGWIRTQTQALVNDPGKLTDAQAKRVREAAEYNTFQDLPLKFSRHLIAARESFPIIKVIFPYFNTLVNLGKRGLEMTPGVGLVAEGVYRSDKSFDPSSYGHTKADIIAKQLEGAMFIAAAMILFDEDEMTGAAPDDPNERRIFYETGKIEYAMKVGDYWYSYANLQPFNVAFAIATNTRKYIYNNLDKVNSGDPEVQEKVTRDLMQGAWSIGGFLANNDFMRGFEQLATATTAERRAKKIGSYAEFAFVPYNGFLRWMMKTEKMMQSPDGTFVPQKSQGILETSLPLSHNVMNKLFGLPLTATNRLSVWGEPYTYSDNKWYDSWLPVQYAKAEMDSVDQLMEELQWAPELPRDTYVEGRREYRYDPEIWQQLALGQGAEGKPALARLIERPSFQRMHREDKLIAMDNVLRPIRKRHQQRAKAAQRRAGLRPIGEGR